jgi:hypothetical protein
VSRSAVVGLLVLTAGCSSLSEGAGGVVGLEIQVPANHTLEVTRSIQLTASALDKDGNVVPDAVIRWHTPDTTLAVDSITGVITGRFPGTGRVQATQGSLTSSLETFNIVYHPDTLIIVGDSVVTVAPTAVASTPLVVSVQTFSPVPGTVVPAWPVIYSITSPPATVPPTVELPGAVLSDTLSTGTDGAVSTVTLNRVAGIAQPDTAIVEVRTSRTTGEPVPGSGQRFIVIFQ